MILQTNPEIIGKAIQTLRDGGIVIFPTDTAFGIGCRIDNEAAVDRLFEIRKRPRTQATPVLVDSIDMALAYFMRSNDIVRRFMDIYWPGALTIIDSCDENQIYSPIRGGGKTIGLRKPNHEIPLALIAGVGVPILGPSANFHGMETPYVFERLDPKLCDLVDFVVPGLCQTGIASTVVDCSVRPYKIVRQGSVQIK